MQFMDTVSRARIPALAALLILCSILSFGQNYKKAQWSRVRMDSVYDGSKGNATKVIEKHKATSPSLLEPIGKSGRKLESCQLAGFVTDVLLDYAAQRLARATKNPQAKADMAIVYFRDRTACLPAGDIVPRDILSLFPMDNKLIMLDIKGKWLKDIIRDTAKKGAVLSQMEEPVDDNRVYKIVTIDCLLRKENSPDLLEYAEKLDDFNTPLGNVIIQHIKKLTRKGEMIK